MTKRLVGSRIARKQAEDDVKLLANRIALLKMEEQKVSNLLLKSMTLLKCCAFIFLAQRYFNLELEGLSAQLFILQAWKKIEETKKKAKDIMHVKQRN